VFADSVYAGERVANASSIVVEIVRKLPNQVGSKLLPCRWVVERFFAWVNRNRRLAKDFEATIASATAFLHAACQADGSLDLRFELDSLDGFCSTE
jgi:putative transposase